MDRPRTTMFMLMSLDGKISTGYGNGRDFDVDLPTLGGHVAAGLRQYYEAEQETSLWSLNTGTTLSKIGINDGFKFGHDVSMVNFVVIPSHELTGNGIMNLASQCKHVYLMDRAINVHHVPYSNISNVTVIQAFDFEIFITKLSTFGCDWLTVQCGSTINKRLFEEDLIDEIDLFVAPVIVGGNQTPSLVGGYSISGVNNLDDIRKLKLDKVEQLRNSYIRVKYSVDRPGEP